MSKCTVLTMFFNLKDLKDATPGSRSFDFYLKNGIPTLQIDNPMIIFCDSYTKPLIQDLRTKMSGAPTLYIEKNITDYEYYILNWPIINTNRSKSMYYKDPTSRNTVSYFLMGMFKIMAFKIALERNDFNSSYFLWMDLGCSHVTGEDIKADIKHIIDNPNPKISVMCIRYRSSTELEDMPTFCNTGRCGIATTIITAEKTYIDKLYSHIWSIFYEKLSKGIGHTDETVFTYCYNRHPDLFSIYYGDYYSTISNYHYVKKDYDSIKDFFIIKAINCIKIKESIHQGFLDISVEEQQFLDNIINW